MLQIYSIIAINFLSHDHHTFSSHATIISQTDHIHGLSMITFYFYFGIYEKTWLVGIG